MDQVKQIDQNQDNNINTQELLDAMKPNGFLSNENNLEEVGKLLSNEELSEEDKALVGSLKSTIDNEINTILEKGTATEEDIMLINIRKELLGENDDRVQKLEKIINNGSKNDMEIAQDNQEVDIVQILQELDNEIETALNSPLNNLQELGIDISLQNNKKGLGINWINILNNIKCLDDLGNITEENVNTYLNIPNNVPKENYGYIAENLKNILYTHLAIHPEWKNILQKGGYASGISIESVAKGDVYEISLLKQIENLQKKSLEQQVEIIVSKLPNNSDLLDLWLKQTLNSDQHNQEAVLINLFDKIPVELSDKFFQTCEKNSFINELKNNYALYWLNKNNCIKSDGDKYCFLDRANPKNFSKLYGKGIVLSDELNFDDLYNHTKKFYEHLNAFGFDTTIPLNEIIKFLNAQDNYYKKIKNASDICERETKYAVDSYNPNYMPVGGSPSAGHAHLGGEIHAAKEKFQSEKSKACAELEKEYVKVLLQKKPKPIGDIMGISGAGIALKFDKDPGRGTLDERADKIVRDTFTEQLGDQREKFKYDLKNDRQAAFGSAMGMIGGIAGSAVAAIFTKNIWATSAGFTLGLRLGNGVGQELWNGGEFLYEQVSGNTINDGNNKVEKFGQGFLRGVGALDQNYEYVGTSKFLSGLGFDYLSTVATFGLSQKFGGFLGKLEGIKFAGGALKFGMEELILENFFVDIPMNIVQTGFETFTGIDDGVTIGNTAIGNQHTIEGQGGYKSGSISDMLRAMKDATTQNLSFENLSQTFFNTIIYGGFLEGGGAAIKKMKGYLPAGQVSNFTERSAAAATAFEGLTKFMNTKNINFNKDGICIDTKTNLKIEESDPRFKELISHIKAVEATKAGVIESFETIMETQKQMVSDPENRTGLLFRLGLISPTNTPLNILKKKKELAEKKLNEAKAKGNNNKANKLQKLLDIYVDAEAKLGKTTTQENIQGLGNFIEIDFNKEYSQSEDFLEIKKSINDKLRENPDNVYLQRRRSEISLVIEYSDAFEVEGIGKISCIDMNRGIYKLSTSKGDLFGSIYSIIDANATLLEYKPIADAIAFNENNLMGIKPDAGIKFSSTMVNSGSFAQANVHKYPADIDLAEHIKLTIEGDSNPQEALSKLLVTHVQNHIKTILNGGKDNLSFIEAKIGYSKTQKRSNGEPKSLKWSAEEILAGVHKGEGITLEEACKDPGFFKFDYTLIDENGIPKECTKVTSITIEQNGKVIQSNIGKGVGFQEVYFSSPEGHTVIDDIYKPENIDYYHNDFLKKDISHYREEGNALKVCKRLYNYVKTEGGWTDTGKLCIERLSHLFENPVLSGVSLADGLEIGTKGGHNIQEVANLLRKYGNNYLSIEENKILENNLKQVEQGLSLDNNSIKVIKNIITKKVESIILSNLDLPENGIIKTYLNPIIENIEYNSSKNK